MKLLRTFPPLNAQPIISIAVTLVRDIPEDVSLKFYFNLLSLI